MKDVAENHPSSVWTGRKKESRKSYRRKTIASVSFSDRNGAAREAVALNLSTEGAYIQTDSCPVVGEPIEVRMQLPTGTRRPIHVVGQVMRRDPGGVGIVFSDIHARDRSALRKYTGYEDLVDAVVSLQNKLEGILSGNLLPVSDWREIEERLIRASQAGLKTSSRCPATVSSSNLGCCTTGGACSWKHLKNLCRKAPA